MFTGRGAVDQRLRKTTTFCLTDPPPWAHLLCVSVWVLSRKWTTETLTETIHTNTKCTTQWMSKGELQSDGDHLCSLHLIIWSIVIKHKLISAALIKIAISWSRMDVIMRHWTRQMCPQALTGTNTAGFQFYHWIKRSEGSFDHESNGSRGEQSAVQPVSSRKQTLNLAACLVCYLLTVLTLF